MAVRIRLKRLGRKNRAFFRLCAMDQRTGRDGRVIEELGTYDPMVRDVDARARLNGERINYWLSVGALPSQNARVLIAKYGASGSHLAQQAAALERLAQPRAVPDPAPARSSARPHARRRGSPAEPPTDEAASTPEVTTAEAAPTAGEGEES